MYVGKDFSPAQQSESLTYGLDFVRDINSTAQLTGASWSLIVTPGSNGTDPSPSSHLIGPPSLAIPPGTSRVTATVQRIAGLFPDVRYTVIATVNTDGGDTVQNYTHIQGISIE